MRSLVFGAHRIVFFLIFFLWKNVANAKTWGHRDLHFVESGWRPRLGLPTTNPGHGIVFVGFCPLLKRSVCFSSSYQAIVLFVCSQTTKVLVWYHLRIYEWEMDFLFYRTLQKTEQPFCGSSLPLCYLCGVALMSNIFSRWIGVFGIATLCCCLFPKFLTFFSIFFNFFRRGSFLRHHRGCVCSPSLKLNWAMNKNHGCLGYIGDYTT